MAKQSKATTPLGPRIKNSVAIDDNGCWVWQLHIAPNGYGVMSVNGRSMSAHRVAYKEFNGPLIKSLQIDHLCKNTSCVNPDHLEQVTSKENIHRSNAVYKQQMARTRCPKGHEYNDQNTYYSPTPHGGVSRSCKACASERTKCKYRLTHANVQDGMPLWAQLAARTHCNRGHKFTEENTYRYGNSRKCKTCEKNHSRLQYAQLRQSVEVT